MVARGSTGQSKAPMNLAVCTCIPGGAILAPTLWVSMRKLWLVGVAGVSCIGCSSADEPAAVVGEAQAATRFFVSASSVAALDGSLESITPAVQRLFPADPLVPEDYLEPMSCLGYYGPIGPWGPLALLGPLGRGGWTPAAYVSGKKSV